MAHTGDRSGVEQLRDTNGLFPSLPLMTTELELGPGKETPLPSRVSTEGKVRFKAVGATMYCSSLRLPLGSTASEVISRACSAAGLGGGFGGTIRLGERLPKASWFRGS